MLKIRLRRMGSRKDPFYRVVVSDGRSRRTYDPGTDPAKVHLDVIRADEWIRRGARPSTTVKSLLEKVRSVQT